MTDQTQEEQPASIALITGGSRGIRRATVLALADRGVDVIFTYRGDRDAAAEVSESVSRIGRHAFALPLDVAEIGSFPAFADRVRMKLAERGREHFDYLVNNAGTSHHNSFAKTTEAELDALYQVHVKGVFFLTQTLLPLLADGGGIVNLSTGLTRFSIPGSAAYALTKGAVEVLTRYLAKELASRHITANTVAPGAIATDFSGGMVRDDPVLNRRVAEMTALGRVGEADDVGALIAALLGPDGRWVTGQRVEVSGGMML